MERGIDNLLIVGAGTMGAGIAQVWVANGVAVELVDPSPAALQSARGTIDAGLKRWQEKGLLHVEERAAACERLTLRDSVAAAGACDFAIEAVPENLELKLSVFRALDAHAPASAILASNTSAISITALAAATGRPESVVGMHFMNPVPVMALVEVVRGERTAEATVQATCALASSVGKTPVVVEDSPGFVSNRVLMPLINEAIECAREGIASREDIDRVLTLGMGHPMGPLALADLIGLDVCLGILEVLHRDLGDPRYRPSPMLRRLVAAGRLGKKSGAGFFEYRT